MTPVVIVTMVVVRPFMVLWVGPAQAASSAATGLILLLGVWLNGMAQVPYFFHLGRGRPDVTAKFHMIELLPFLACLLVGVRFWGIEGAAWAWTLRLLADALLLYGAAGIPLWRQSLVYPAIGMILVAFGLAEAPVPLLGQLAGGGALLALALVWAWSVAPPPLRVLFSRPKAPIASIEPKSQP